MLLAVVPAFNEDKTIDSVVRGLFEHVDEVVVVDDGSTDMTNEYALKAGATVIRHAINRGQGAALQTGHEYARRVNASRIVHFDADGQFDPSDIAGAVEHLVREKADIVLGSRFLGNNESIPWSKRRILIPLARFIHRLAFGVKLTDAHNGFRVIGKKALMNLEITQDRMAHASQIPALASRARMRVVEYPVRVTYHSYGQRPRAAIGIIVDLITGGYVGE